MQSWRNCMRGYFGVRITNFPTVNAICGPEQDLTGVDSFLFRWVFSCILREYKSIFLKLLGPI